MTTTRTPSRRPSTTDLLFVLGLALLGLAALILMTGELLDRIDLTHDRLDQIEQQITDQHHDTLVELEQIGAGR